MLSFLTASLSVGIDMSTLKSRMMSDRRSCTQQLKRAVRITSAVIAIPALYMAHWRLEEDYWLGSNPLKIFGESSLSF